MHANSAMLTLISGALLLSGCESDNQHATTAPPPSQYETVVPPIMQSAPQGNQLGTSASAANPAANPTSTAQRPPVRARIATHKVAPGDSLWSLSRRYETSVEEIRQANQLTGNVIRIGETLKIPTSMPEGDPFGAATSPPALPPSLPSSLPAENQQLPAPETSQAKAAPSSIWTLTPPVTPPTSSGVSAPQYRIPEPVILPPPGEN